MIDKLSEDMKKLFLMGVGAVAVTAEKAKDIVDDLVRKGELSIEQGKVLNEELKHHLAKRTQEARDEKAQKRFAHLKEAVASLSAEELAELKRTIQVQESNRNDENGNAEQ